MISQTISTLTTILGITNNLSTIQQVLFNLLYIVPLLYFTNLIIKRSLILTMNLFYRKTRYSNPTNPLDQ